MNLKRIIGVGVIGISLFAGQGQMFEKRREEGKRTLLFFASLNPSKLYHDAKSQGRGMEPLVIDVEGDGRIFATFDRLSDRGGADNFTWFGRDLETGGRVVLTVRKGILVGKVIRNGRIYRIVPTAKGRFKAIAEDSKRMMKFGDDIVPAPKVKKTPPPLRREDGSQAPRRESRDVPRADEAAEASAVEVDLMMLYTSKFKKHYGDSSEAVLQNLFDVAQDAYRQSDTGVDLHLVDMEQVPEDSPLNDDSSISRMLENLSSDGYAAELRRRHHADMVSLLSYYPGSGYCGLGDTPYRSDDSMISAFSAVYVKDASESGSYCSDLSLAHEMGHNFGCHHDRDHTNADENGETMYPYAFGYDVPDTFATIMSYDSPEIAYFSNPDITDPDSGLAIGVADEEDNARAIRNTRYRIADNSDEIDESLENGDALGTSPLELTGKLNSRTDRDAYTLTLGGSTTFHGSNDTYSGWAFYINLYDDHYHLLESSDQDFTIDLADGDYKVVVTFYSDEDGRYYDIDSLHYRVDIDTEYAGEGNHVPVIQEGTAVTVRMSEDGDPTPFGQSLHAEDADGDALSWRVVDAPEHGSAGIEAEGGTARLSYRPQANWHGSDRFVVAVSDGHGGEARITVNVEVESVNDAPIARDREYRTQEDASVRGNVLSDGVADSDVDGDSLRVKTWGVPGHGSLSATGADGGFTYVPDPGYNGTDRFSYTITDGHGGEATAEVTITIAAVNDVPVIQEGTAVTVRMSEDGDPTPFGQSLHAEDADGDALSWRVVDAPEHGSAGIEAEGGTARLSYRPQANWHGSDRFVVAVSDGHGGEARITVNVEVESVNDAPIARDREYRTQEDASVRGNVLSDGVADSDVDGDSLRVKTWGVPGHGSLSATGADGGFTYVPDPGYNGTDRFSYTITDGHGGEATAEVRIECHSSLVSISIGHPFEINASMSQDYVFHLKKAATLKIYSRGNADTAVTLENPRHQLLAQNDDFNGGKDFYLEASLMPGYYIVAPAVKSDTGSARIYIERVDPSHPSTTVPISDNVSKLYVATFDRAPDAAGLKYWVEKSRLNLEGVAASFFDQPETRQRYPEGTSDEEFVTAIYRNLFNRDPDPDGLIYWTDELKKYRDSAGRLGVPRNKMILAVINGARDTEQWGMDATILVHKTVVAEYYVAADLNDIDLAKEVLEKVDETSASVTRALEMIDAHRQE